MAMMPKRLKHSRKFMRGRVRGQATAGHFVAFGEWGIQSMEAGRVTAQQIEAARVAANRYVGGQGRMWIRIFPHKSHSSRPAETRMGKGKGEVAFWYAAVRAGTVLFELGGVSEGMAREAFKRQAYKLPVKTCFARRRHSI
jgi:large subunit ribosomal protein L16